MSSVCALRKQIAHLNGSKGADLMSTPLLLLSRLMRLSILAQLVIG